MEAEIDLGRICQHEKLDVAPSWVEKNPNVFTFSDVDEMLC